jgi:hypothetical protein
LFFLWRLNVLNLIEKNEEIKRTSYLNNKRIMITTIRYLLMTTALICLCFSSFAQKVLTFKQAKEQGIRIEHLDSIYASGINADSSLSVFKNNQENYIAAYQKMLQDLGNYLKENHFLWNKPTKGFNRIYFDKSGKIDYFLYNFRPEQLTVEEEIQFNELLQSFVSSFVFSLNADKKFAQCSPVTYMPIGK